MVRSLAITKGYSIINKNFSVIDTSFQSLPNLVMNLRLILNTIKFVHLRGKDDVSVDFAYEFKF